MGTRAVSRRLMRSLSPVAALALVACSGEPAGDDASPAVGQAVTSPAGEGARLPRLVRGPEGPWLSWVEEGSGSPRVLAARRDGEGWSRPVEVAGGEDLLLNWADFPSVLPTDGGLAAHWLVDDPRSSMAYSIRFRPPGSEAARPPHEDDTATEHGFVSLMREAEGVGMIWLDGRHYAGPEPRTQLRYRRWSDAGPGPEIELDDDVCSCCDTDAAPLDDAGSDWIVVYRDHTEDDVRDIAFQIRRGGVWSGPATVHDDGWRLPACPVNGPSVDVAPDGTVAVAWFTGADGDPRVLLGQAPAAGESFGDPQRIDEGDPLGRVAVRWRDDRTAAVLWLERGEDGAAHVSLREIRDGVPGPAQRLGTTRASRHSGFPQLVVDGGAWLVAWTVPGPPAVVELRRIPPPAS